MTSLYIKICSFLLSVATGVWDLEQFLVDVHNWALVYVLAVEVVGDSSKTDNTSPNKNRVVHGLRSDDLGRWEERHDERESDVSERDNVHWNGSTAHGPSAWWEGLALEALEKNATNGDEVASEKGGYEQGDDGVEGRG
jgi:hypothetical protein